MKAKSKMQKKRKQQIMITKRSFAHQTVWSHVKYRFYIHYFLVHLRQHFSRIETVHCKMANGLKKTARGIWPLWMVWVRVCVCVLLPVCPCIKGRDSELGATLINDLLWQLGTHTHHNKSTYLSRISTKRDHFKTNQMA